MNDLIKTATSAARAFYEASQAFDEAKEALEPLAKQQIEITKRVAAECNMKENYSYKPFFYYDWIELEVGGYYEGSSDTPVIECQLWYRGRCGDHDSNEGSFTLSQHIINGEPEKFEAELRAKLETEGQKKARAEREQKERQIAQLQADLKKLEGEVK
jgi:hypothetical protein